MTDKGADAAQPETRPEELEGFDSFHPDIKGFRGWRSYGLTLGQESGFLYVCAFQILDLKAEFVHAKPKRPCLRIVEMGNFDDWGAVTAPSQSFAAPVSCAPISARTRA